MTRPNTAADFWTKVDKADGCWLWTGHTVSGYGRFKMRNKVHAAHRFAYEHIVGPIPDGLQIDHVCRVRNCVNPDHLEPVTQAENIKRGYFATKPHCPQGHPYAGDNLYVRPSDNARICRACTRAHQSAYHQRKRLN
jgi:hypothetical protein